jgi:hypothetical protein
LLGNKALGGGKILAVLDEKVFDLFSFRIKLEVCITRTNLEFITINIDEPFKLLLLFTLFSCSLVHSHNSRSM